LPKRDTHLTLELDYKDIYSSKGDDDAKTLKGDDDKDDENDVDVATL
jgi:hypothetical protein